MDKRLGRVNPDEARTERERFFSKVSSGEMTLGQAVRAMRKISRLTQPEFAAHRGISVQALRQIERDQGNPTVETINKIGAVFGLQAGFVPIRR